MSIARQAAQGGGRLHFRDAALRFFESFTIKIRKCNLRAPYAPAAAALLRCEGQRI
jgi:hypothetical protein